MPGIVGLLTDMPRSAASAELHRMLAAMCHESFYEKGIWIDESLGLYVGWVARRGAFAERMPVRNERCDVTLVFAGEDFPESGTTRRLKDRGHTFDAGAGAAYLAHLYEEDADGFPAGLNGRFHGLVADASRRRVMLFNDRWGMQRIYYHEAPDAFYFAAEAKAILAVRPDLNSLDTRSFGELVSCGCVLENRTLFKNIHVLPAGSAWVFDGGAVRRTPYFRPREWESQPVLDGEAYYRELRQVFARQLPLYLSGQDRVGMSLTGGLDTRMIMAWAKAQPGSLPCYSFGGAIRDCQDVQMARTVARVCDQPYEVIPAGSTFLARFAHYAERSVWLTDGCTSVDRATDLYLNERARQIAPIRLTGNYGGEVLRRVRAFRPFDPLHGLFRPEVQPLFKQASDTYGQFLDSHPLSFAVFHQAPWHHYGTLSLEETQLSLRSPFLDNAFVQTVFRAPPSACVNEDVSLRLIADGDPHLRKLRTDRGVGGALPTPVAGIVKKYLDFTFKAEYAYDSGMPQWMATIDHALAALHLERVFLGRHKFAHFRVWYRDQLSGYVKDVLLDERTLSRPYLNRKNVAAVVDGHLKGNRNYTDSIHQLLTLELIHRLFLDRSGSFS